MWSTAMKRCHTRWSKLKTMHLQKTTPLLPFPSEMLMYRAFLDGSSCRNYSRTTPVFVVNQDFFRKYALL